MDRRTFLKSSGAAAAAASATAVAAEQAQADAHAGAAIRTALAAPYASGYLRDRADRLALRLREISDGRINLQFETVAGNGADAVLSGAADAYFGSEADHVERHGALAYVSALPGDLGLGCDHFMTWLSAGGGQMHWDHVAAELGYKALAVGHSGRGAGLWAMTDVNSLADLAGQSIATHGLAKRVGDALGLEAQASDAAALIEPLMGPTAAMAGGASGQRRYWWRDGLNRSGVVLSLGLALSLWQRLTDGDRAVLTTAASEAFHQSIAEHTAHDRDVAPHLFAHHDVRQRPLPDDIRRAIDHISQDVISDIAAQDTTVSRIHESYMVFRKNVVGLPDPLHSSGLV